jgi:hypothetical protein
MDEEMTDERNPPEAELARLADGSLPESRQAELRAQVKGSPQLTAALAEQERALTMLRALDQPAPAALRARVHELTAAGARRGHRPVIHWRRALVLPGATALAVVAAAVVILVGAGGAGGPTVPQAARLALAAATLPAPAPDAADPGELSLIAAGIPFPNWAAAIPSWRAVGARTDRIGGRTVTTVFYYNRSDNRSGEKVGYAIASGAPLSGVNGRTFRVYGTTFTLARQGSARLITWVRSGHTCVIAGRSVNYATLRALAGADERETGSGSPAALQETRPRAAYL